MGKLGGREISYGSDLDVVFVTNARAADLPRLQPLAAELMELLSARTECGVVFQTDARLRPDGEKGLLVNTLEACEEYYRRRAALWEIQALTRVRPVAGNLETGARFQRLAAALTNFTAPPAVAAYTTGWLGEIDRMRERIEKERTPPGKYQLAIKTGVGGLMDAEFLAQATCLARGWQEANTMKALRRGAEARAWPAAEADALLKSYGELRRIEGILRRWSFEGETVLPDDEPAQHRGGGALRFPPTCRRIYAVSENDANGVARGLCASLPAWSNLVDSKKEQRDANIRIRIVRRRLRRVRGQVHLAPPAQREAIESLPGLPTARAQNHLHLQFACQDETCIVFRRQESGLHRPQAPWQRRI